MRRRTAGQLVKSRLSLGRDDLDISRTVAKGLLRLILQCRQAALNQLCIGLKRRSELCIRLIRVKSM